MTKHELIENLAYKIDENYNEAEILGETINTEWLKNVIRKTMTKSHADWLRSEIEKLEGMKKTKTFPQQLIHFDHSVEYIERLSDGDIHYNQALTSIITRYKEELKVLEGK